jgi:hypothetical protein
MLLVAMRDRSAASKLVKSYQNTTIFTIASEVALAVSLVVPCLQHQPSLASF